jgi:hypothetical protein
MEPHLSSCVLEEPRRHRPEAYRLTVRERQNAGMAEDQEPEFGAAMIWATSHLKYAQYRPTHNNRKNNPRVTISDGLMASPYA